MTDSAEQVRLLAQALSRKDGAGKPIYSREETFHVLTFLVVAGLVDSSGIPRSGRDDVARVFGEAQLRKGDSDDEVRNKIADYYARHPPNRSLLHEIFTGLAGMSEQAQTDRLEKAAQALSGNKIVEWSKIIGDSQPSGTRAGPLAQFLLMGASETDEKT
jgi:hypothetical protein